MSNFNKIGQKVVIMLEKILFIAEKDMPVYTLDNYEFLKKIQDNSMEIKNEILQYDSSLLKNMEDLSEEQQRIVEKRKWKVLFLKVYGKELSKNISAFPITSQLLKTNKITTAMFSILEPQTLISAHRGPYKGVLRYHLGLVIPTDYKKCAIRINSEVYNWKEGESLLFDDTYEHEAWNYSQERRVILFLDIERNFKFPFNVLNKIILFFIRHSPFVKGIYSNS